MLCFPPFLKNVRTRREAQTCAAALPGKPPGLGREQVVGADPLVDDALRRGMADQVLDHLPVGRDAVGERVALISITFWWTLSAPVSFSILPAFN